MAAIRPARRCLPRVVVAVGAGAALAAVWVAERSVVAASFALLGHVRWLWILAAVVLESASMAAFAIMQRRLLAAGGASVGIRPMLATTYAANAVSVSVPLAGPELATAFAYRRFTRQGADAPVAGWSLLAGWVVSSAAAALVAAGAGLASGKILPDGIRRERADPTDPAAARGVVDRIAAEVGPPEVLVNTIGTYRLGEALTATPEDLRLMIDVNVGPALWLTQAVVPYLRERGSGAIVHVAARPGLEPVAGMAAYAVSKAALVHLTRVLDLELRPLGIRVNAVAPQQLDTAKTHPYLTPEVLAHAAAPEAVADIIVYLVSDAAALVSGAVVPAYGA